MKLLAAAFSTLTTVKYVQVIALWGKIGGKKSIYTLFFFMPLFTGHTSLAITSYALSQELCKNHK